MNKPIINGIDVSECRFYEPKAQKMTCHEEAITKPCESTPICYYKLLQKSYIEIQRLQEENKSLQMLSCANCGEKYLSPDGAELYDKNVQLQKENEELKEKVNSYICNANCYKYKEASKYKQALKKIRDILCNGRTFYEGYFDTQILSRTDKAIKVINEVLND